VSVPIPRLQRRPRDAHKGTFGTALVVAGSENMLGAAILCARGALRGGAGLVRAALPRPLGLPFLVAVPAATTVDRGNASALRAAIASAQAVVIGPGLGEGVEAWLGELLARATGPRLVLDADAWIAIARRRDLLALLDDRFVLTPHAGEAARLLGWGNDRERVEVSRHAAISQLCTITRATVVLKGAGTMVARRGSPTVVNPTGNAGLAKAGSGDVLSGILGALLARGMHGYDAAIAAVWIHGRAADVLAQEVGEDSYISSDLARALGRAFSDYAAAVSAAP